MKKIIITGGTGFIGLSLAQHLAELGFHPVLIARKQPKTKLAFDFVPWDAVHLGEWIHELNGAFAIVNLAGRSVDCIKSPENCDVILRSRVDSTRIIGKALNTIDDPPNVWVQMSTAHIYGDPPSQICNESSSTGYGLAPFVGKAWEAAFLESLPTGIRGVRLRTSFVIGKNGGAMLSLKRIAKLGFGGKAGTGKQGISWIHEYDMNEIIHQAIINREYNDFYISSAPNPVSNKEFMYKLRRKLKIPIGIPAPAFITRLGAKLVFKTDPELVLYGRYVQSERLEKKGFKFKYPDLNKAFDELLEK